MISFSQVEKRYGEQVILDGLTLSVARGSFVALVGQSGTGKTTLLKAINRLVEIDAGAIHVDGANIRDRPAAQLRRGIGYVFQGVGLFPHLTVAENIWMVPRLLGMDARGRDARVAELLELVALPQEIAGRRPDALSGGQAQRVGFARGLAAQPSLMLMDEPFGAVDPISRAELGAAYRALHDRLGLTTVMVTHDMAEALLLADRVIVLGGGRLLADMPPADLMRRTERDAVSAMIDVVRQSADRLEALARGAT